MKNQRAFNECGQGDALSIEKYAAYHEAGHAVVWCVLTDKLPHEIIVQDAIPSFSSSGGYVQLFDKPNKPVPPSLERAHLLMILAGAAAQAKYQRRSFLRVWNSLSCEGDQIAAFRYCEHILERDVAAVKALVNVYWEDVVWLAQDLITDGIIRDIHTWQWHWKINRLPSIFGA